MGPDSAGGRVVSDTELFPFPKKEKFSTFIPYQGLKTPDIVTNVLFFSVLATTGIFTPRTTPETPCRMPCHNAGRKISQKIVGKISRKNA
jgi:hypothetical protein